MSRTCLACRTRKMRCDGATPVCGPCSRARKPMDCTYRDNSLAQRNASLLPKGAACLPCRRKKKKCDAERPFCKTCHLAGKDWECEYDEEIQQNLTTALITRTKELEERLAVYESQQRHMSQPPAFHAEVSFDLNVSLPQWQGTATASRPPQPLGATLPDPSSPAGMLDSRKTAVFFQNPHSQGPPPLGRNFFPNPPRQQNTSPVGACQGSYELRCLFLDHQIQLGFYLRDAKLQAVKCGDVSGRVAHPALVYLAQLIGGFLWRLHHNTDEPLDGDEVELRNILRSLEYPPDPATLVVIYILLGEYLLFKKQLDIGRQYLIRASQVLPIEDLQLSMPNMSAMLSVDEPDEDTKEYISALAQLSYIDKATSMVLNFPPFLEVEYDRQLKALSFMQPWLARNSVLVARCKSISLLRDAMRLSHIRATASANKTTVHIETALPMEWYTQYWETLEDAAQHVAVLYPQMLQASLYDDVQHALCLKVCIIVALAAQIELHRMPGYYHAESRQKALTTILEVISLTRGLRQEDYAMLEPTLGICFTIVANTLRDDRDLQIDSTQQTPSEGQQEVLAVLIDAATQLATKIPYIEPALHTLHEIASGR